MQWVKMDKKIIVLSGVILLFLMSFVSAGGFYG